MWGQGQSITVIIYGTVVSHRMTNKGRVFCFSHSYRASWYYQGFIYSPTDVLVSCLKTILKFTLKFIIKTAAS